MIKHHFNKKNKRWSLMSNLMPWMKQLSMSQKKIRNRKRSSKNKLPHKMTTKMSTKKLIKKLIKIWRNQEKWTSLEKLECSMSRRKWNRKWPKLILLPKRKKVCHQSPWIDRKAVNRKAKRRHQENRQILRMLTSRPTPPVTLSILQFWTIWATCRW